MNLTRISFAFYLTLFSVFNISYAQLKVSEGKIIIYNQNSIDENTISTYNIPSNLNIVNRGAQAGFTLERLGEVGLDSDNFLKAAAGGAGSAFFFNKNTYFAITPGDNPTVNIPDNSNSLFIYGTTSSYPGRVGIGTNTPNSKLHVNGTITHSGLVGPSDSRLKKNIQSLEYGLLEVLKINPVTYHWNEKLGINNEQKQVGVLAQNVQTIMPDIVSTWTFKDTKNNDTETQSEEFLAIQTDAMQYVLINAIRELHTLIEAQTKEIESLKQTIKSKNK